MDAVEAVPPVAGHRAEERVVGHRAGVSGVETERGAEGLGLGAVVEAGFRQGEARAP